MSIERSAVADFGFFKFLNRCVLAVLFAEIGFVREREKTSVECRETSGVFKSKGEVAVLEQRN